MGTPISGTRVSATLNDLLKVSNSNSGVDGTLHAVSSGNGSDSALQISTAGIKAQGTLVATGASTLAAISATTGAYSGTLSAAGNFTASANAAITGNLTVSGTSTFTGTITSATFGTATVTTTLVLTGASITAGAFEGGTLGNTTPYTIAKIDNITIDGNSITATNTNGSLSLIANGTGKVILGQTNSTGVQLAANQPILDSSGNSVLGFIKGSSIAVNQITVKNNLSTFSPSVSATGSDTDISLLIAAKGAGTVDLGQLGCPGVKLSNNQPIVDINGNEFLKFSAAGAAVNEFTVGNASTGNAPTLSATGGDTNVSMVFQSKGNLGYNFLGTLGTQAFIKLFENTAGGTNSIKFLPPASIASDRTVSFPDTDISQFLVQRVSTTIGSSVNTTAGIPLDNTIPQSSEGTALNDTVTITPKSASNKLRITVACMTSNTATATNVLALFQDATANALAATVTTIPTSNYNSNFLIIYEMAAGTTSSTTFKLRIGTNAGTNLVSTNPSYNLGATLTTGSLFEVCEYSV